MFCGNKIEDDSLICDHCESGQGDNINQDDTDTGEDSTGEIQYEIGSNQPEADFTFTEKVGSFSSVTQKIEPIMYKLIDYLATPGGKVVAGVCLVLIVAIGAVLQFSDINKGHSKESDYRYDGDYGVYEDYEDTYDSWSESETDDESELGVPLSEIADGYVPFIVRWIVEPEIEADDINVLYCGSPYITGEYGPVAEDYTSSGMHKYDRICLIIRDGNYGMINYNGGIVTGVDFYNIRMGYNQDYFMKGRQNGEQIYYTFTPLYELKKLEEEETYGLRSEGWLEYRTGEEEGLYINDVYGYRRVPEESMPGYAVAHYVVYEECIGNILLNNGKPLLNTVFSNVGAFNDKVIPVEQSGKWGYFNSDGELVLDFEYDACWKTEDGMKAYNASSGYIVVRKNNQYAMYDTSGRLIIDFGLFDELRPVYEGVCWAKQDGLWGVLAVSENATVASAITPEIKLNEREATVKSSNGLRMREGPGTSYCVVHMLSNHKKVIVCGTTGEWSYIRANGVYGWVKSEFIK